MAMASMVTTETTPGKIHTNEEQPFRTNQRYFGHVKLYKQSAGYGFLRVRSFDVFFHIKDLSSIGINSVKPNDAFTCKIQEEIRNSKKVYRAYSMAKCPQYDDTVRMNSSVKASHSNSKYRSHKSGNSGSLVAIPHPKDVHSSKRRPALEVAPHHGEIVAKNLNVRKTMPEINKKQKPVILKPGMIKIGPVCNVQRSCQKPIIVSATGPHSAEVAPPPESLEVQNLKEAIEKKKTIFRSLNREKLPDGGRRLKDDIGALEIRLRDLIIKEKVESKNKQLPQSDVDKGKENKFPPPTKLETKGKSLMESAYDQCSYATGQAHAIVPIPGRGPSTTTELTVLDRKLTQTKLEFPKADSLGTKMGWGEFGCYEQMQFGDGPLYGGRMNNARLTEVRKVTKGAIEDLHRSLSTRPGPEGELEDPAGLKVTLMIHQRQALAWLVWREAQTMSGGILADDMGLGKTLTMISLILKQRENEDGNGERVEEEEYDIQDFDSSADSCDSDVIVVNDGTKEIIKQENKPSVSEKDGESSLVSSESTLIVAPASLLFHWEKEIRNRCNKGLLSIHLFHGATREKEPTRLSEFDVVITTYDIVRRCGSAKESGSKQETTLMQINWRRIILDEAHQIKNFKSQSSEAVCKLESKTRWAMSGTPVQNNLTDMYAMLKFLHCRPFDEYKVWKNQVDNKTHNGKERLKTLISCIVLRREKSDSTPSGEPLVELPKRTFLTHNLKLNDIEREVYDKLQSDSKAAFRKFQENKKGNSSNTVKSNALGGAANSTNSKNDAVTATTLLVMLLRLRQCCGHLSLLKDSFDPELLSNEKKELALEDIFQSMDINKTPVRMADINVGSYVAKDKTKYFDRSAMSGKLEFVLDELNKLRFESPDDKCVIVSQWTSMLEVISHHLEISQISYTIIKGSVSAKKRMDMVEDFNRNPIRPKVMLLSLQAGGVGLNLIGGNHLYLLDMHWNPALECQAFDRIYRVGQKKPVFVHKFVVKDTVEERIQKLQEHKLSLAKGVMQGAGSEDCKKLTLQDMKLLFGI